MYIVNPNPVSLLFRNTDNSPNKRKHRRNIAPLDQISLILLHEGQTKGGLYFNIHPPFQ